MSALSRAILGELTSFNVADGVERSSNTVAGLCYPAFKAKYPNGKHREILIAYEDLRKLTGRSKTMHARVADWNAHARKLGEIGETGHGKAFETLSLSCGSNVNQDKSLSAVCESALAEGVSDYVMRMARYLNIALVYHFEAWDVP